MDVIHVKMHSGHVKVNMLMYCTPSQYPHVKNASELVKSSGIFKM